MTWCLIWSYNYPAVWLDCNYNVCCDQCQQRSLNGIYLCCAKYQPFACLRLAEKPEFHGRAETQGYTSETKKRVSEEMRQIKEKYKMKQERKKHYTAVVKAGADFFPSMPPMWRPYIFSLPQQTLSCVEALTLLLTPRRFWTVWESPQSISGMDVF